jgi:hypothetical protein
MEICYNVQIKGGFMNEWMQFSAIIFTVLGTFGFLWRELKTLESRIDKQSNRTDKLYEMFIDLLKEQKK